MTLRSAKQRLRYLEQKYGGGQDIVKVTTRILNPDGSVQNTLYGQCSRGELEADRAKWRAYREQFARKLHNKPYDPRTANGLEREMRGMFDVILQSYEQWKATGREPMYESSIQRMEDLIFVRKHVDDASDAEVIDTLGQGIHEGWLWIEAGLVHSVTPVSHPDQHANSAATDICFWQRVAQRLNRIVEQRGCPVTDLLLEG